MILFFIDTSFLGIASKSMEDGIMFIEHKFIFKFIIHFYLNQIYHLFLFKIFALGISPLEFPNKNNDINNVLNTIFEKIIF